ncbi:MAG TPA: hypothetical protein VHV83_13925 [Armatimonadota bacterium]|nr:hypothetical protein [Armatimonadota bacterium]
MMKASTILSLMFALVLATVTVVCAADAGKGNGTLTAKGDGNVRITVREGQVELTGKGTLQVSSAATVTITGTEGTKEDRKNKDGKVVGTTYKGFDGKAVITGSKYMLVVQHGTGLQLTATGKGRATLIGKGTYTVMLDGDDTTKKDGEWSPRPAKPAEPNAAQPADGQPNAAQQKPTSPEPITFGQFTEEKHQGARRAAQNTQNTDTPAK